MSDYEKIQEVAEYLGCGDAYVIDAFCCLVQKVKELESRLNELEKR